MWTVCPCLIVYHYVQKANSMKTLHIRRTLQIQGGGGGVTVLPCIVHSLGEIFLIRNFMGWIAWDWELLPPKKSLYIRIIYNNKSHKLDENPLFQSPLIKYDSCLLHLRISGIYRLWVELEKITGRNWSLCYSWILDFWTAVTRISIYRLSGRTLSIKTTIRFTTQNINFAHSFVKIVLFLLWGIKRKLDFLIISAYTIHILQDTQTHFGLK